MRVLREASGIYENAMGKVFGLRSSKKRVYLAFRDVLITAKEFTLNRSIRIIFILGGGGYLKKLFTFGAVGRNQVNADITGIAAGELLVLFGPLGVGLYLFKALTPWLRLA